MIKKPRISAIAAIGTNRELGNHNELLWKFEADFARMKSLIRGHALIMGRKTYESIGREMPHSPCVVITSDQEYRSPYKNPRHTNIVHSLQEALRVAIELEQTHEKPEVFIFGGAQVYTDALAATDRLYMTEIDAAAEADSFFPDYSEFTNEIESTSLEEAGTKLTFRILERG